jgi:ribonuclease D
MPLFGFDTEFIGERTFRPELCLVQVSTSERLYLIDPLQVGSLEGFWELMLNPSQVVLVHAGREDVRMCWLATGQPPRNVVDVQIAAGLIGLTYPIGYAGLVQELLHMKANKGETLTDWKRRPLTAAQLRYAYDDVRFLIPAWQKIQDRLQALGRLDWIRKECEEFLAWATESDAPQERWRKLKGIGRLNRRELAVVRAIHGWREKVAEKHNRPVRSILRDDVVIEIARTAAHGGDLSEIRGAPQSESSGLHLLVRGALALRDEECPEPEVPVNDPPQVATLASLLNVVLGDLCARLNLAPSLVATGQDVKELIRARIRGREVAADCAFARGWRAEVIRPHLDEVLDGQTVIRVSNPKRKSPLNYPPYSRSSRSKPSDEEQ